MSITCLLGGHSAFPSSVRNQGFYFSKCRCCGQDMIRSSRGWQKVPRGFRVVWRRAATICNLPVAVAPGAPTGLTLRLAAALDLAGTALRAMFWLTVRRLGAWRASLRETPSRPRVLLLPAP